MRFMFTSVSHRHDMTSKFADLFDRFIGDNVTAVQFFKAIVYKSSQTVVLKRTSCTDLLTSRSG